MSKHKQVIADLIAVLSVDLEARKARGEAERKQFEADMAKLLQAEAVRVSSLTPKQRYDEYLRSSRWDWIRRQALHRAMHRCQLCGCTDKPLDVHHNSYERLFNERPEDLIALCRDCHDRFHDKLPEGPQ